MQYHAQAYAPSSGTVPPYAFSTSAAFFAAFSASICRFYEHCLHQTIDCMHDIVRTSLRASNRSCFSLSCAFFLAASFFCNFRLWKPVKKSLRRRNR